MLDDFTVETFEGRKGERFWIEFAPGEPIEAELDEATRLSAAAVGRRDPFSLVFRTSPDEQHEQRIYRLEHDELGSFELFLVPIAPGQYEAVFA